MGACGNCGTSTSGIPAGCGSKGNCATGGCNKLNTFNWLGNMSNPANYNESNLYEVRFKNDRKEFFHSKSLNKYNVGDVLTVDCSTGFDIGVVSLKGELVKIQFKNKNKGKDLNSVLKIHRLANEKEISNWQKLREREHDIMVGARKLTRELNLDMKISDVEFQGDGSKAVFFYTSDNRVDFRELIKTLAGNFRIGVEMRQIGYRQEAAKVGGIGSCGRELCCSSWLTDFRAVNTNSAKYQQLSINPQKLAGQCGKLKCCLNFELDSYLDALKNFPDENTSFLTELGKAYCVKINIFKGLLWFTSSQDSTWYKFTKEEVFSFIGMEKEKGKTPSLKDLFSVGTSSTESVEGYNTDIISESNIDRFTPVKTKNFKKTKFRKPSNKN